MTGRRVVALLLLLSVSLTSLEVLWADAAGSSTQSDLVSTGVPNGGDSPTLLSAADADTAGDDCLCLCACACAGAQSGALSAVIGFRFDLGGPLPAWIGTERGLPAPSSEPHLRPPLA